MAQWTPIADPLWLEALLGELAQRAWDPVTPLWGYEDYDDLYYAQRSQLQDRLAQAGFTQRDIYHKQSKVYAEKLLTKCGWFHPDSDPVFGAHTPACPASLPPHCAANCYCSPACAPPTGPPPSASAGSRDCL